MGVLSSSAKIVQLEGFPLCARGEAADRLALIFGEGEDNVFTLQEFFKSWTTDAVLKDIKVTVPHAHERDNKKFSRSTRYIIRKEGGELCVMPLKE